MIRVRPLLPADWPRLELLFGKNGACGGCWCMYWQLPGKAFTEGKGEGNRAALRAQVEGGAASGVLAFDGEEAVGWAAVGPRSGYARVVQHRNLRREAGPGTWALPCFYVPARQRGRGVAAALIEGAVAHAFASGATEVEAYPVAAEGKLPAAFAFTGVEPMFAQAGFTRLEREGRAIWLRARA